MKVLSFFARFTFQRCVEQLARTSLRLQSANNVDWRNHEPDNHQREGIYPLGHRRSSMEIAIIVCDCHLSPMYYSFCQLPELGCVMCWVSDCERYYSQHLGYFHLRAATPTALAHIDKETQGMMRCSSETCTADSSMVIIRANLPASDTGKPNWHCFECGPISDNGCATYSARNALSAPNIMAARRRHGVS
jgi:hypothetical protein